LDILFDDGKAKVEPEAAAAWLVELAVTTTALDVAEEIVVDASAWPVISAVLVMVPGEDGIDEKDVEVAGAADAEEAPVE
jgi:hypothetical protein